jgi:hypothetical protein
VRPYVICRGDHLSSLAYQFGFNADTVWSDPKNAQLRGLRPDPNILFPGDVLYIPDQKPPVMKSLTIGTTNTFVSDAPTVTLTQQFVGPESTTYASRAYTVQELDQLMGLSTDANGVATFQVPVTLATATVVFTDTGESWALQIGSMDPINTPLGIFKRLQNLGYIGRDVVFDTGNLTNNLDVLRMGLRSLKASQDSDGDAGPSSASSSPLSEPAPASDPGPASAPPSSPPSEPGPASDKGPGSAPSSSANTASVDDSGLADDGTLNADTTTLLRKAHSC